MVGANWYPSFVQKHHYKCRDCYDARRRYNRRMAVLSRRARVIDDIHLLELRDSIKRGSLARKDGYVYCIVNPAWPEWVKIGRALDPYDRLSSYQTGSPHRDYRLIHYVYFADRYSAERTAHDSLDGLSERHVGEWFMVEPEKAVTVINETLGRT